MRYDIYVFMYLSMLKFVRLRVGHSTILICSCPMFRPFIQSEQRPTPDPFQSDCHDPGKIYLQNGC